MSIYFVPIDPRIVPDGNQEDAGREARRVHDRGMQLQEALQGGKETALLPRMPAEEEVVGVLGRGSDTS